jgi:hypothetical protein
MSTPLLHLLELGIAPPVQGPRWTLTRQRCGGAASTAASRAGSYGAAS